MSALRAVGLLKSAIRQVVPMMVLVPLFNVYVRAKGIRRGFKIAANDSFFRISDGKREIRLARSQAIYLDDTMSNFDFYFGSVTPERVDGMDLVDFSAPKRHGVKDFPAFPVLFPAVAEPVDTARQYLEFAELGPQAVVIDLGAYSGLTSILFDMAIPGGGTIVAVEADRQNITACVENFAEYQRYCGRSIHLIEAAIWKDDQGVAFSSEGNMGSSVLSVVGTGRGKEIRVASVTLEGLAKRFDLQRIDLIKCDIEGGEIAIFDRPEFFARYSPKIMIECHGVKGESTSVVCAAVLEKYGYTCKLIEQRGYPLPLLACVRNDREGAFASSS